LTVKHQGEMGNMTPQTGASPGSSPIGGTADSAGRAPGGRVAALIGIIWTVAGASILPIGVDWASPDRVAAETTIDPNTAAWWELSMLPEIGEALARDIERFSREAQAAGQAAFTRAADLDQIRGIGPKIIQRIAPHLSFRGQSLDEACASQ
jgi:hypothetical protein